MPTETVPTGGAPQTSLPMPVAPDHQDVLIAQPERARLPIRIPVTITSGRLNMNAEVIGSTSNVLLLQSTQPGTPLPPLGTPLRLRVDWDRQLLIGRLAAHGVAGRFLMSIGERAIRYSRRYMLDLPGLAQTRHLYSPVEVRIADLSTGGARVKGIDLPVGTEVELRFTPPGHTAAINVLGFVVRAIEGEEGPSIGVAFRLVQASIDLLQDHAGR